MDQSHGDGLHCTLPGSSAAAAAGSPEPSAAAAAGSAAASGSAAAGSAGAAVSAGAGFSPGLWAACCDSSDSSTAGGTAAVVLAAAAAATASSAGAAASSAGGAPPAPSAGVWSGMVSLSSAVLPFSLAAPVNPHSRSQTGLVPHFQPVEKSTNFMVVSIKKLQSVTNHSNNRH